MKVQYFGDVSDYRKYALLRAFARVGLKIGVCWVMTESDERSDGQFRRYIEKPNKWRQYDPELFDFLETVQENPAKGFKQFEVTELLPSALYFNALTPDGKSERQVWHRNAMAALAGAELVFFDPDNGFEVSSRAKGRKYSSKFTFFDEVADHYREGRSVLVYQHFPRKPRAEFIKELAGEMRRHLSEADVWAFETAHVVFMLGAQPNHRHATTEAAGRVEARLVPDFFRDAKRTAFSAASIEKQIAAIEADLF